MGYLGIGQPGTAHWNLKIKMSTLQGTYQIPSCVFQYVAYKEGTCPNYASQTKWLTQFLLKGMKVNYQYIGQKQHLTPF